MRDVTLLLLVFIAGIACGECRNWIRRRKSVYVKGHGVPWRCPDPLPERVPKPADTIDYDDRDRRVCAIRYGRAMATKLADAFDVDRPSASTGENKP